jgi:hypothetical protein
MRSRLLGLALAGSILGSWSSAAPHAHTTQADAPGSQADRTAALAVARQINMAEAAQKRFGGVFVPFDRLTNVSAIPSTFRLHLVTDGRAYQFALKEKDAAAGYAIVSDDSGVIYEAVAVRGGGLVPIGTF